MIVGTPQDHPQKMNNQILRNASKIISYTGLLKNEVVKLNVGDIEQNGSVVSLIQPVPGPYPKYFQKAPITVSDAAREILEYHINYLKSVAPYNSPKTPLFPIMKSIRRYEEKKLWNALSCFCRYYKYDRHREAGIHRLSWEMSAKGFSKNQIVEAAHKFSRYKNIKKTEILVNEGIHLNPSDYDEFYSSCRSSAGFLVNYIKAWPDRVEQQLIKLESCLEKLYERDINKILSDLNKALFEYRKVLKLDDQSLKLADYVPIITRKRR